VPGAITIRRGADGVPVVVPRIDQEAMDLRGICDWRDGLQIRLVAGVCGVRSPLR
jgi:hypothetical protein